MAEAIRADVAWRLARALAPEEGNSQSQVGTATVTRVDADGTVWVRIPGSDIDTPANGTVTAAAEPGHTVGYRIESGRLSVTGNVTSPAVGGTYVTQVVEPVERKADEAMDEAWRAHTAADAAEMDARRAQVAADSAQQSADDAADAAESAQQSATTANRAANDALTQLSTVQDVVGVVEWAATHSDQDMATYISSHLALTDAGLWVLKDASGYKVLLSNDGMSVVNPQGHVVSTFGESISFDSSRPQYIGGEDAYVVFTPASGTHPATVTIGGNVLMGGSGQSLSDLLDGLTYDHSFTESDGVYTFRAYAYKGGIDVTDDYDPDFFGWWLRTELGDSWLGSGVTMSVMAARAGYRGAVVGGLMDVLAAGVVTDEGDAITDADGNGIVTHWVRGE